MNENDLKIFRNFLIANNHIDRTQEWLILEDKHEKFADGFEDAISLVLHTFDQVFKIKNPD